MVEACEKAGVPLMVHENFRFQAPMIEVKRVLAEGVIGELTWGRVTWRTDYDVYAGQPYLAKEKRFILLDLGIHVLDLARLFMGEVERVLRDPEHQARHRRRGHGHCCCATRAARSAWSTAPTRRSAIPIPSRRRCWRSRAAAAA